MINVQTSVLTKYPQVNYIPTPILSPFFLAIKKVIHQNDINRFLEENKYLGAFSFIESVLEYFNFSYMVIKQVKPTLF